MNGLALDYRTAKFLQAAAELGAKSALEKTGAIKPYLSKNEAYRLYGRGKVDKWIEDGVLKIRQDGAANSKIRISRAEIEALAESENIAHFINT